MSYYRKMYRIMFNAVCDAQNELEQMNFGAVKEILQEAQLYTKDIFISQAEGEGSDADEERREKEENEEP